MTAVTTILPKNAIVFFCNKIAVYSIGRMCTLHTCAIISDPTHMPYCTVATDDKHKENKNQTRWIDE